MRATGIVRRIKECVIIGQTAPDVWNLVKGVILRAGREVVGKSQTSERNPLRNFLKNGLNKGNCTCNLFVCML